MSEKPTNSYAETCKHKHTARAGLCDYELEHGHGEGHYTEVRCLDCGETWTEE